MNRTHIQKSEYFITNWVVLFLFSSSYKLFGSKLYSATELELHNLQLNLNSYLSPLITLSDSVFVSLVDNIKN